MSHDPHVVPNSTGAVIATASGPVLNLYRDALRASWFITASMGGFSCHVQLTDADAQAFAETIQTHLPAKVTP